MGSARAANGGRVSIREAQIEPPLETPRAYAALPSELEHFLNLPGPQSLILRGNPGTGKTTMALALLDAFRGKRVLVTGRVSRLQLRVQFPWLAREMERSIDIVDTTTNVGTVRDTANLMGYARNFLLDLDRPESAKALWLPPQVQEAWATLPREGRAMIVIDSWDSLIDQYLGPSSRPEEGLPDRSELESHLFTWLAQTEAHLVVLLEQEAMTHLDYLASGSVLLTSSVERGRRERWLALEKLRGVSIEGVSYPFTLDMARFRSFGTHVPDGRVHRAFAEDDPQPKEGQLWPGARSFHRAFGRLPVHGITLVEAGPTIYTEGFYLLTFPVVRAAVNGGASVLVVPPPALTPHRLWESFAWAVPPAVFRRQVRIASLLPGIERPKEIADSIVDVPIAPAAPGAAGSPELVQFLRRRNDRGTPNLCVTSMTGLSALAAQSSIEYTPASAPILALSFVESAPVHLMVVGTSADPILQSLTDMASAHIRLEEREGRGFLYGFRPRTPVHVLLPSPVEPGYELVPVV